MAEGIHTAQAGVGQVNERAIRVQSQSPTCWLVNENTRKCVTIDIHIIGQHAGRGSDI